MVSNESLVSVRSTFESTTPHGVLLTFAAARTSQGTMASMASSLAGTPILARPRASTGTKFRRAMRCNASAVSDAAAADSELGYPFVKIVGQEELKLALTLNVVVRAPAVFTGAARPTSRANANARGPESGHGNASSLSRRPQPSRGNDLPPRAATDGRPLTLTLSLIHI